MRRFYATPRVDYQEKIEALGFDFHSDYWREEAYYQLLPKRWKLWKRPPQKLTACIVRW